MFWSINFIKRLFYHDVAKDDNENGVSCNILQIDFLESNTCARLHIGMIPKAVSLVLDVES